jgi:hypothetical protein
MRPGRNIPNLAYNAISWGGNGPPAGLGCAGSNPPLLGPTVFNYAGDRSMLLHLSESVVVGEGWPIGQLLVVAARLPKLPASSA